MSNALTVLNNQTAIQQGGLGLNLQSKLLRLKPATLNIIQPNSQAEGKKGGIRIIETGDVFTELDAVFLAEPEEKRNLFTGKKGELNRSLENLVCFSSDGIVPDPRAKKPQAMFCANCPKSDWRPYRAYQEKNGTPDKDLAPPCEPEYRALILDTKFRMPMRMYIRGKSLVPFRKALEGPFAYTVAMAQAQGKNPNLFDVKFKIRTKQITTGKFVSYIYDLSQFSLINPDERETFGELFLRFQEQQAQAKTQPEEPEYETDEASAPSRKELEYEEGEVVV